MPALFAPPGHEQPRAHTSATRSDALTIGVHLGAADFHAQPWDALTDPDGGFYTSHRWIRSLELVHGAQPVLAAAAEGRLSGVLPTWTSTGSDTGGLFSLPEMTRGLIAAPSRKVLWLGPRRATAAAITCARGAARTRTLAALMETARRFAADQHLAGAVWPYLSGAQALEAAACHPLAQAVLHTADTAVTVPRDGMRAIEDAARSKDRRQWRRERSLFTRSGTVEWTTLTADTCTRIAPLLAATRDKYAAPGGTSLMLRTLTAQLASGVARQTAVALARTRDDDTVRAAAVFYRHGTTLYGRYWGTDGKAPPYSYFNLTLYEAVDWAARHGLRRLHLSVPATAAKRSRGAQTDPLALVYLPATPDARIDTRVLHRHNRRTAQEWNPSADSEAWTRWTLRGM
ncbi:GNAT family N-acetyltransferase [Streptomyces sp. NPDC050988]|uniref:GNAT family N-acetyltransferase n=1 Tax=Streptomyces sp. NPDC050988 TaxID=3365637 RepID=UPI0037B8715E